jgi:uncharacterized membrane protein YkvA (DUF1232 family)
VLLRGLLAAVAALAVTWAVFVVALSLLRPRGIDLREAKRLVPDVARLVRGLAGDASLPRGVRRRLALLLAYLAFPIDLVPDVVPVLGYADDVVVIALVLRSVVRRAGPAAVERHWTGTPAGLAFVRSLAGIA